MSLHLIKPYFIDTLDKMALKRWPDAFSFDNIPSNIIDGAYHVLLLTANGVTTSNQHVEIIQPVEVRVFFKGYRDVEQAELECRTKANLIISSLCYVGNQTQNINGVYLDTFEVVPFETDTQDNVAVARFTFDVRINLKMCF